MKVNEFIGLLFLARDLAHSVHLSTRSYAQHKALDEFYHGIIDHADAFAEAYQGRHGLMGPVALQSSEDGVTIIKALESQLTRIEKGRYEICDEKDTALQQLIDNIVELYLSTLYKLKFLA